MYIDYMTCFFMVQAWALYSEPFSMSAWGSVTKAQGQSPSCHIRHDVYLQEAELLNSMFQMSYAMMVPCPLELAAVLLAVLSL